MSLENNHSGKERGIKSGFKSLPIKVADNVVNTFRVAPQWQVPSIVLGSASAYEAIEAISAKDATDIIAYAAISLVCAVAGGIAETAAVAYLLDYKKMKRSFSEHGWDTRVVRDQVDYYCGKRAAKYASKDAGYLDEFNSYLEQRGL